MLMPDDMRMDVDEEDPSTPASERAESSHAARTEEEPDVSHEEIRYQVYLAHSPAAWLQMGGEDTLGYGWD